MLTALFLIAVDYVDAQCTNPQPVSVTVSGPSTICGSSSEQFEAEVVNGGTSPTYFWYKNGFPVDGPHGSEYIPTGTVHSIECIVYSNQGCVTGNPASSGVLSVTMRQPAPPVVYVDYSKESLCAGESITFTVFSYSGSLSNFRWRLNGSTVGTNSRTFTTNQFTSESSVSVTVNVTGSCLTTNTATASLYGGDITVYPVPNPVIIPRGTKNICSTCSQSISATPTGSDYTYQWYLNGSRLSAPQGKSNPYTATSSGVYKVEVTGPGNCKSTSPTLTVVKNTKPVANAGSDQLLVLPTNYVTLNGSGLDVDENDFIADYLWEKISGPEANLLGANTANLSVSGMRTGTYVFRLTVEDDFEETAYDDVTVTVNYPPNNFNWIKEATVNVAGQTTEAQVNALSVGEKKLLWQYYDGLGRPMQSVIVQASPSNYDLVQPIVYDALGREAVKYLPYVSDEASGAFKTDFIDSENPSYTNELISPHYKFYQTGGKLPSDSEPYGKTIFEPSPLNRVIKQGSPGQVWQPDDVDNYSSTDYTIKFSYETNAADEVVLWTYNAGVLSSGTAATRVYYAPNELYKTRTKDEQQHEVIEYKDKEGKVVLKKVQAPDNEWAQTYYIYDDFGNLVLVLPPEAVKVLAGG